jgi:hypothetical protein
LEVLKIGALVANNSREMLLASKLFYLTYELKCAKKELTVRKNRTVLKFGRN